MRTRGDDPNPQPGTDDGNPAEIDEVAGGTPEPEPEPEEDELLAEIDEEPEPEPESTGATPDPSARQGARRQRGDPERGRAESENRRLRRQVDELTRQVQQVIGGQRQPTQAELAEQERVERERFELMTPWEQKQHTENRLARLVQAAIGQAVAPIQDQNDRSEYEREIERNPKLERYRDQVEDFKRQAPGVPRRMLLATALGLQALESQGRLTSRAARRGAAAAEQHRAAPSQGGRSDTVPNRGRRGDDLDERLRGQAI